MTRQAWRMPAALLATLASVAAAATPAAADLPAAELDLARPARLATRTDHVEHLVARGDTLYAATRGGLEVYDLHSGTRRHLYTTADGLAENHLWQVALGPDGAVQVRARRAACTLRAQRFACTAAPALTATPAVSDHHGGARVTVRLTHGPHRLVGTAGAGLWLEGPAGQPGRRLTPTGQICSNHIKALARWRGRIYLGSFGEGMCVSTDGVIFARLEVPFRMVNALLAADGALYVAAGNGLFVSHDGLSYQRLDHPGLGSASGLAPDARHGRGVWVINPGALLRLRPRPDRLPRVVDVHWRPGGSSALQAVAAGRGQVWLATEDRGVLRLDLRTRRFAVIDRAAGLTSSWTVDVALAEDGTVHAGTLRHGLASLAADGRPLPAADWQAPDPWVLSLKASATGLWVGTQGGAALLLPGGQRRLLGGLPDRCVHAFLEHGGGLWVATEAGLAIYAGRLEH